jgi:hypothetical protein
VLVISMRHAALLMLKYSRTKVTNDPPLKEEGLKSSGPGKAATRACCTVRVNETCPD